MPARDTMLTLITAGLVMNVAGTAQNTTHAAFEHYQAGSQAFIERRFDKAIDALNASLALDQKQLRVIRLLGLSYQLSGKLKEAEAKFLDACRLAPKDAEAWFYLGRVYYLQNFFDKSQSALETAVNYGSNDARFHELLALTFEATGDTIAAEREYEQSIHFMRGTLATPYLNYGVLLLKLNRVAESEQMLLKAVALMSGSWNAHFEVGKLYCQTNRFDAALRELTTALRCGPAPEEIARTHGLLATVYSRLGRDQEARIAAAAAEK